MRIENFLLIFLNRGYIVCRHRKAGALTVYFINKKDEPGYYLVHHRNAATVNACWYITRFAGNRRKAVVSDAAVKIDDFRY